MIRHSGFAVVLMLIGRCAVLTLVCGLALTACGGGGTTPAPNPTATAEPAPTAAPLAASNVFAADPSGQTTVEYGRTGTAPIGTLSATGAPNAFAFDASGNVYVAFGGSTVEEHAAGTHRLIRSIAGFHHVNDIALDAKGVLYVVDGNDGSVPPVGPSNLSKVLPGATSPSSVLLSFPVVNGFFPSLNTVSEVVVDAGGNVYAAADNIYVFAPGATGPTRTIPLAQPPSAIAFDLAGNLYAYASEIAGGENESNIYRIAPGGSTAVSIDGDVGPANSIQSLAFDPEGDFYELNDPYSDYNGHLYTGGVVQLNAMGSAAPARTFDYPVALAADPVRNLYVLDADSVSGAAPSSTYHISQYAYNSAIPTRTFESNGTAIGLSSVP